MVGKLRAMSPIRYVFVGGLHRSGTSLVARMLSGLPGVAGIEGADVPENEGVYLQGAIPHTARHGRPMQFATDPDQHHVEGGRYDRLEVKQRLEADWDPWFAPAPWRVEKSPVNLTRMRLYQQLFPRAQFVVVIRHPQMVAAAVSKWMDVPEEAQVRHWIDAHRIVLRDLDYLHAAMILRYEDIVARPDAAVAALSAFLDRPGPEPFGEAVRDGNGDYPRPGPLADDLRDGIAPFGYGAEGAVHPVDLILRHPLRSVRDAVDAAWTHQA